MTKSEKVFKIFQKIGVLFAFTSVLFGFILGAVFGIAEDSLKSHLLESSENVFISVYQNNQEEREKVLQKSWIYIKRAHLHAGAIGGTALGGIACMVLLTGARVGALCGLSSLFFGVGGLLYGLFWLLAGFEAPSFGSTALAKEAYSYIAISGAGSVILGALGGIFVILVELFDYA
jgi:hypothetical protein